jgi:hypothetical protein
MVHSVKTLVLHTCSHGHASLCMQQDGLIMLENRRVTIQDEELLSAYSGEADTLSSEASNETKDHRVPPGR